MAKNIKCLFGLLIALQVQSFSFGQTDSTDIDFHADPAIMLTLMDTIMYSDEPHSDYHVEFDISDTLNFYKLRIDVGYPETMQLVSHHSFTFEQLSAAGFIENWHVHISLGNHPTAVYKATIVIEKTGGEMSPSITKTITE